MKHKDLNAHFKYGWLNGCRYGMGDGPDDYVNECECNETQFIIEASPKQFYKGMMKKLDDLIKKGEK